jgi:hypothetical protein
MCLSAVLDDSGGRACFTAFNDDWKLIGVACVFGCAFHPFQRCAASDPEQPLMLTGSGMIQVQLVLVFSEDHAQ